MGEHFERGMQLGLGFAFLTGVFRDDVTRFLCFAEAVDFKAGSGNGLEQLCHLGRFEDFVKRDTLDAERRFGVGVWLLEEVGVEAVQLHEGGAGVFVFEKFVGLLVAIANARDVTGERHGFFFVAVEVVGQLCTVANHAGTEFFECGEAFDDFIDLRGGEGVLILDAGEHDVLGAEFEEDAVHLLVVVDVLLAFLALDPVERRLGNVNEAAFDEPLHLAVDEGKEQGADVGAVHVSIGHDDDFVVAGFVGVEAANVVVALADAGAKGGDEGSDFLVAEDLVEAGFLAIDDFASERENGLKAPVAALFGGATGGITFDEVNFAEGWIAFGAVGEFAGQAAARECAFADGFAGFARGFAGACGVERFVDDAFRDGRVGFEEELKLIANDALDDAIDFAVGEFGFGLSLKAWFGNFDRDDGGEAFADVVAGDGWVFFFDETVGLGEIVDDAGERGAEAGEVRAALDVVDRVGVGEDLVVVAVVVLHRHIDDDVGERGVGFVGNAVAEDDGLFVDDVFVRVEEFHELGDAVFEEELVGFLRAIIDQFDADAGVEEGEFAQALGDDFVLELAGGFENFDVGLERDFRTGFFGVADDGDFLRGFALGETHLVNLATAPNLGFEPFGDGVDAFRADAVEAAGDLVGAFAELTASVKIGENEFECGDVIGRMDVDGDAAAVVFDRAGAVEVDGDLYLFGETGEALIDTVVHDLENAVVEAAFVGVADVHIGTFADAFEALQFLDFRCVVVGCAGFRFGELFRDLIVGHIWVRTLQNLKGRTCLKFGGWTIGF